MIRILILLSGIFNYISESTHECGLQLNPQAQPLNHSLQKTNKYCSFLFFIFSCKGYFLKNCAGLKQKFYATYLSPVFQYLIKLEKIKCSLLIQLWFGFDTASTSPLFATYDAPTSSLFLNQIF